MSNDKVAVVFEAESKVRDLLESVDCDDPDPQAVKAVREWFEATPDAWRIFGDVNAFVQDRVIERLQGTKLGELATKRGAEVLRDDLGYQMAPEIERILIDHAVVCWLRWQNIGWRYDQVTAESITLERADFWERRLSAAQRRFLRAVETLARVRKVTRQTLALQVNIAQAGGQQVNVIGDVRR